METSVAQKHALLIDLSLCVGCKACQAACKVENHLPAGEEASLSPTAYTALDELSGVFVRRLCQHCEVPTCASVCPVSAFTKTPEGPVLYDAGKCIGCRYCMQACPFSVPRYEWASTRPRVQKCIFCAPRLEKGLPTACAEACPVESTMSGGRDEMLRLALDRIAARPKELVHKVYGRSEAGGTSVFYISHVPFEQLGFETRLGTDPLPMLTMSALSKVPNVVAVGGTLLAGIWWITNRRDEVRRHEDAGPDTRHQDGSEQ